MSTEASTLLPEAVFSPGIRSPGARAGGTVREGPWLRMAGSNPVSSFAVMILVYQPGCYVFLHVY